MNIIKHNLNWYCNAISDLSTINEESIIDLIKQSRPSINWVEEDLLEDYFFEIYGIENRIGSNVIEKSILELTDDSRILIKIFEHYVDSGSIDYAYTIDVTILEQYN
jgi:hypothetical protein